MRPARLACTLLFLAAAGADAASPGWRVGSARSVITPAEPMWMAGYASRVRPAEGTLHDLWVKVLAVEAADGGKAVIVTADILGFPRALAEAVCRDVEKRHGLARGQVMLCASHTHSGPVIGRSLADIYPADDAVVSPVTRYTAWLKERVVAAVGAALQDLEPAELVAAEGSCGFAVNRRENPESLVPQRLTNGEELAGPVDHRVPVLAARTKAGWKALLVGYACHNTTLSFYSWCGDYAGFAQLELERALPDADALFFSGCGADQNPIPRRTLERARLYGWQLAAAAQAALADAKPLAARLRTGFELVPLKLEHPSDAELTKLAKAGGYKARWANRLLEEKQRAAAWPSEYAYPVQVWKLGEQRLIALGGEVVVDYSLRFRQSYGPMTWTAGYANDLMAYIPSARVRNEGRYEAGAFDVYGLPAVAWQPEIEDRIAATVDRLMKE